MPARILRWILRRRLHRILFLICLRLRVMCGACTEQGSTRNRVKRRTGALDAGCVLAAAICKRWHAGETDKKPGSKDGRGNFTHAMSVTRVGALILTANLV